MPCIRPTLMACWGIMALFTIAGSILFPFTRIQCKTITPDTTTGNTTNNATASHCATTGCIVDAVHSTAHCPFADDDTRVNIFSLYSNSKDQRQVHLPAAFLMGVGGTLAFAIMLIYTIRCLVLKSKSDNSPRRDTWPVILVMVLLAFAGWGMYMYKEEVTIEGGTTVTLLESAEKVVGFQCMIASVALCFMAVLSQCCFKADAENEEDKKHHKKERKVVEPFPEDDIKNTVSNNESGVHDDTATSVAVAVYGGDAPSSVPSSYGVLIPHDECHEPSTGNEDDQHISIATNVVHGTDSETPSPSTPMPLSSSTTATPSTPIGAE